MHENEMKIANAGHLKQKQKMLGVEREIVDVSVL